MKYDIFKKIYILITINKINKISDLFIKSKKNIKFIIKLLQIRLIFKIYIQSILNKYIYINVKKTSSLENIEDGQKSINGEKRAFYPKYLMRKNDVDILLEILK